MADIKGVSSVIVNMIKAAYLEHKGGETTLTDEQVAQAFLDQDEEDREKLSPENWADVIEDIQADDETSEPIDISADDIGERERLMAEKLTAAHWQDFQNEDIRTADFRKQVTVLAYTLIVKDFTNEERAALPDYDSEAEDRTLSDGTVIKGSNNPDVYRKKNLLNGKNEKRHKLWDIVDVSPVGRAMHNRHAEVYKALHNIEGCDKDLANMGTEWLDSELKMQKQRISTIRRSFINGLKLAEKVDRVNKELPKVELEAAYDQKGNLRRGSYCMELSVKGAKAHDFLTAGQVIKIDIDKATRLGGTMADVKATFARQPKIKPPAASAVKLPETKEAFYSMASMLHHYLDHEDEAGRKRIAGIVADMAGSGEGSDTAVEQLGDLIIALDGEVWKHIEKRYNALKAAKAAQGKPAKAEKPALAKAS